MGGTKWRDHGQTADKNQQTSLMSWKATVMSVMTAAEVTTAAAAAAVATTGRASGGEVVLANRGGRQLTAEKDGGQLRCKSKMLQQQQLLQPPPLQTLWLQWNVICIYCHTYTGCLDIYKIKCALEGGANKTKKWTKHTSIVYIYIIYIYIYIYIYI